MFLEEFRLSFFTYILYKSALQIFKELESILG